MATMGEVRLVSGFESWVYEVWGWGLGWKLRELRFFCGGGRWWIGMSEFADMVWWNYFALCRLTTADVSHGCLETGPLDTSLTRPTSLSLLITPTTWNRHTAAAAMAILQPHAEVRQDQEAPFLCTLICRNFLSPSLREFPRGPWALSLRLARSPSLLTKSYRLAAVLCDPRAPYLLIVSSRNRLSKNHCLRGCQWDPWAPYLLTTHTSLTPFPGLRDPEAQ